MQRSGSIGCHMEMLVPRGDAFYSVPRLCHNVSARCSGFVMVYSGLCAVFGCLLRV